MESEWVASLGTSAAGQQVSRWRALLKIDNPLGEAVKGSSVER